MRDTVLRHHAGQINIRNTLFSQQGLKLGFKEAVGFFFNDYRSMA